MSSFGLNDRASIVRVAAKTDESKLKKEDTIFNPEEKTTKYIVTPEELSNKLPNYLKNRGFSSHAYNTVEVVKDKRFGSILCKFTPCSSNCQLGFIDHYDSLVSNKNKKDRLSILSDLFSIIPKKFVYFHIVRSLKKTLLEDLKSLEKEVVSNIEIPTYYSVQSHILVKLSNKPLPHQDDDDDYDEEE